VLNLNCSHSMTRRGLVLASLLGALAAAPAASAAEAVREVFGQTAERAGIPAVILTNGAGMRARVIAQGATLQELLVPDRNGQLANVVRSYPNAADYQDRRQVAGATVGRFANRIAGARFMLDGREYRLTANSGPNSIHGGPNGFDRAMWTIARVTSGPRASVTLTHTSPDGDEGFPGEMKLSVTYTLDEQNVLTLTMEATTSKPTILNLTNHSYFNLAGQADGGDVTNHLMTIHADAFTPSSARLIPTGEIRSVAGGAFDFRTPRRIGERIADPDPQIQNGRGYDHNWVLRGGATRQPKPAARLEDPVTGRVLELSTTEPGLQVYTGLKGSVAFEPQHFPDSPNHPNFPSVRLDPGKTYRHVTVYKFTDAYTNSGAAP
jgi:aldose 1-epimerase